jgi:hypothetical protein
VLSSEHYLSHETDPTEAGSSDPDDLVLRSWEDGAEVARSEEGSRLGLRAERCCFVGRRVWNEAEFIWRGSPNGNMIDRREPSRLPGIEVIGIDLVNGTIVDHSQTDFGIDAGNHVLGKGSDVSGDGRLATVFWGSDAGDRLFVLDLDGGQVELSGPDGWRTGDVAWSADGRHVAVAGRPESYVFDVETQSIVHVLPPATTIEWASSVRS